MGHKLGDGQQRRIAWQALYAQETILGNNKSANIIPAHRGRIGMKLYKLFSVGLLALTALAVTTLAATAGGGGSKAAWAVPAFCDFGEGQFCQIVHGGLRMLGGPFDDDSAGFEIKTSFQGAQNSPFLDGNLPFPAGALTFRCTNDDGTPQAGTQIITYTEYTDNSIVFRQVFSDANGNVFVDLHNGNLLATEVDVAENNGGFIVNMNNISLSGRILPLDAVHVVNALGCDDD